MTRERERKRERERGGDVPLHHNFCTQRSWGIYLSQWSNDQKFEFCTIIYVGDLRAHFFYYSICHTVLILSLAFHNVMYSDKLSMHVLCYFLPELAIAGWVMQQ